MLNAVNTRMAQHPFLSRRTIPALIVILASGVLMILGGIMAYQDNQTRHQHMIANELQLVNQLQIQGIEAWRRARIVDANAVMMDPLFSDAVAQWRLASQTPADDASALQAAIQDKLRFLSEQAGYSEAYLLSPSGDMLLTAGRRNYPPLPPVGQQALRQAIQDARPIAIDPQTGPAFAYPWFGMIAPVYENNTIVAAVWLVMDVRNSLFPLLETWPSPSNTAESTLVMQEHDSARILSPLRHQPQAKLNFRVSQALVQSPMVQAIHGMRGLFTGIDYRQHSVLAVAAPVAESPWYLISKIDTEEAWDARWRGTWHIAVPIIGGLLWILLALGYTQHQAWRYERRLKALLEQQVRHDTLTQLANRLALDERFEQNWRQTAYQRQPLSVLMVDVDHFKAYNDYFGHIAGDQCLKQVAAILTSVVRRSTDMVSRYGGEEFVILLPDTSLAEARALAQEICQTVFDTAIPHPFSQHDKRVTVSIGIACLNPGENPVKRNANDMRKALLERADAALYAAKSAGRNQAQ